MRSVFENNRSEWPKGLAKLDLGVDDVFHLRSTRIGQDAAVAEGARAPFEPSLEPADHFLVEQCPDHPLGQLALVLDHLERPPSLGQALRSLGPGGFLPP